MAISMVPLDRNAVQLKAAEPSRCITAALCLIMKSLLNMFKKSSLNSRVLCGSSTGTCRTGMIDTCESITDSKRDQSSDGCNEILIGDDANRISLFCAFQLDATSFGRNISRSNAFDWALLDWQVVSLTRQEKNPRLLMF